MTGRRSSTGATNDPDVLSRPVHLFAAGRWRAVSIDRERILPSPAERSWRYEGTVSLGVQHVELPGTEPEPVITALLTHGFYVWQISTDETVGL